jgi:hypothetical protein
LDNLKKETRMWFRHDLLVTDALRKIITHNRGKVENEMIHIISDLIQIQGMEEYQFSVHNMLDMLKRNSVSVEAGHIRKILQDKWKLQPNPPTYYTAHIFGCNGEVLSIPNQVARVYCMSQKQLNEVMSEC